MGTSMASSRDERYPYKRAFVSQLRSMSWAQGSAGYGHCSPWMVGGPETTIVCMNPADLHSRRWLPSGRLARQSHGPLLGGLGLRFRTWRQAEELDEQLAEGADPLGSDELSLRAGQLRSAKTRARIAKSLLAAVEIADREVPIALGLSVHRPEVRDCRQLLVDLAERLGADDHTEVRG